MRYALSKKEVNGLPYTSVSTFLGFDDYIGAIKARWALNRHSYHVAPGLYSVGNPDAGSDVLVSANYKLSFDTLRKNLTGIHAWVLVIDTKGVNVWCAAGKGTFGTKELISKINKTGISKIVNHRRLILPQLGAPGVAAFEVKKQTGFSVLWGPVRASDITKFLKGGYQADEAMRTVYFPAAERLKLTSVEISVGLKYLAVLISVFFLASGINIHGYSVDKAWTGSPATVTGLFLSFLGGTVVTPFLLPYLPFRSFSLKGLFAGILTALPVIVIFRAGNMLELSALAFMMMAFSSFLAMNFTGASTYTSLSGVLKEMKQAVPMQIILGSLGVIGWFVSRFISINL